LLSDGFVRGGVSPSRFGDPPTSVVELSSLFSPAGIVSCDWVCLPSVSDLVISGRLNSSRKVGVYLRACCWF
jgi:hypothetical protein